MSMFSVRRRRGRIAQRAFASVTALAVVFAGMPLTAPNLFGSMEAQAATDPSSPWVKDVTGQYNFSVPDGVTDITVEAWGAGGRGDIGGGGGGAYASSDLSVSGGEEYKVVVGKGGDDDDVDGEESSFDKDGDKEVIADGGEGAVGVDAGNGGDEDSSFSVGDITHSGGNGGDGNIAGQSNNATGGGGGGSAFTDDDGENGADAESQGTDEGGNGGDGSGKGGNGGDKGEDGSDGENPGGGGGGHGSDNQSTGEIGDGADGKVKITWSEEGLEDGNDNGTASITVIKVVDGEGSKDKEFEFTLSPDGDTSDSVELSHNDGPDSDTFSDIPAGTYDLTESVPEGWSLSNVDCTNPEGGSWNTTTDGVVVTLENEDSIECTFTNKEDDSGDDEGVSGGIFSEVNGETAEGAELHQGQEVTVSTGVRDLNNPDELELRLVADGSGPEDIGPAGEDVCDALFGDDCPGLMSALSGSTDQADGTFTPVDEMEVSIASDAPAGDWHFTYYLVEDGDLEEPEVYEQETFEFTVVDSDTVVEIVSTKIVCSDESEMPNWAVSGAPEVIDDETATDWVEDHDSCELAEGWEFQWGDKGAGNAGGDHIGPSDDHNTFGPTDENGVASTFVSLSDVSDRIELREILQEGYIHFTDTEDPDSPEVSAEFYCHEDISKYDNAEWITNPSGGEAYHCVAWNSPISVSGHKFHDLNEDTEWDEGEPGIGNWWIALIPVEHSPEYYDPKLGDYVGGDVILLVDEVDLTLVEVEEADLNLTSPDSDDLGSFSFGEVAPGTYRVYEQQCENWDNTTPGNLDEVTVEPDEEVHVGCGEEDTGETTDELDFGSYYNIMVNPDGSVVVSSEDEESSDDQLLFGNFQNLVVDNEDEIELSSSSATITWETNRPASSRVIYDTDSHSELGDAPNYGYAYSTSETDTGEDKTTDHSVTITGLDPGTTYYYRVVSVGSPETVGEEFTFETESETTTPPQGFMPTGSTTIDDEEEGDEEEGGSDQGEGDGDGDDIGQVGSPGDGDDTDDPTTGGPIAGDGGQGAGGGDTPAPGAGQEGGEGDEEEGEETGEEGEGDEFTGDEEVEEDEEEDDGQSVLGAAVTSLPGGGWTFFLLLLLAGGFMFMMWKKKKTRTQPNA